MNPTRHPTAVALTTLALALSPAISQDGPAAPVAPTTDQLVSAASLTLSEKTESFLISAGTTSPPVTLPRVYVGWQAPDRTFAMWVDLRDRTPLVVSTGGRTIIYDPIGQVIHSFKGSGINCQVGMEGEKLKFMFGVPLQGRSIAMDFGSILEKATQNRRVQVDGKRGGYLFTGETARGNHCDAWIVPGYRLPLRSLDLFAGGETRPNLSVTLESGEGRMDDHFFAFPTIDFLASGLPINPLETSEFMEAVQAIAFGSIVREAIADPSLRTNQELLSQLRIKNPDGRSIGETFTGLDWEKLEKSDGKIAAGLREIFAHPLKAIGMSE